MDHQTSPEADDICATCGHAECDGDHHRAGVGIDRFLAHPETGVRRERPARRRPFEPTAAQQAIHDDRRRLSGDGEARGAWIESIEALLPGHTCQTDGLNFKWTTPAGTWKLELDVRMFGGPAITLVGPNGTWKLSDHRVPYVETFLCLVGAIE